MKRTNPETEQQILTQIVLGYPYADIAENTGVAVSTIKKIKARNKERYEVVNTDIENRSLDNAKAIIDRVYALLARRLDEAGDSMSVEELISIVKLTHRATARDGNAVRPKPFLKQQNELDELMALLDKK